MLLKVTINQDKRFRSHLVQAWPKMQIGMKNCEKTKGLSGLYIHKLE